MFIWLRRWAVLLVLMFWLGGFAFYGGVVIPLGRAAFGPDFSQVTASATTALNITAVLMLAVCAWENFASRDRSSRRKQWRWMTWIGSAVALMALFGLHFLLSDLMAKHEVSLTDPAFYPIHRAYLWIGAAQWLAMLIHCGLLPAAWRDEDRQDAAPTATTPLPETASTDIRWPPT
jgi:hypothetical protein